jgi:hypothetical protein
MVSPDMSDGAHNFPSSGPWSATVWIRDSQGQTVSIRAYARIGEGSSAVTTAVGRISAAVPAQKRSQCAVVLGPQEGCRQALEERQKTSELGLALSQ